MFPKYNKTLGNNLLLLEKSGKRVSLDSEIGKWVKQAILRFKSFRVKNWKNDDVKWNFSKRNQTLGNDLMLLEKCGRRVPLDSEIRKWVKQAILHLNSFRVKHWKKDDVKLNVSEMQPNSWK